MSDTDEQFLKNKCEPLFLKQFKDLQPQQWLVNGNILQQLNMTTVYLPLNCYLSVPLRQLCIPYSIYIYIYIFTILVIRQNSLINKQHVKCVHDLDSVHVLIN